MQRVPSVKSLHHLSVDIMELVEWDVGNAIWIRVFERDAVVSVTLDVYIGLDYVVVKWYVLNPHTLRRVSFEWIASNDGLCQEGVLANRCVMLSDHVDRFTNAPMTIHTRTWISLYVPLCCNSELSLQYKVAEGNVLQCSSVFRYLDMSAASS
jgi:hypothetical protein